jgi:hypothetical protein
MLSKAPGPGIAAVGRLAPQPGSPPPHPGRQVVDPLQRRHGALHALRQPPALGETTIADVRHSQRRRVPGEADDVVGREMQAEFLGQRDDRHVDDPPAVHAEPVAGRAALRGLLGADAGVALDLGVEGLDGTVERHRVRLEGAPLEVAPGRTKLGPAASQPGEFPPQGLAALLEAGDALVDGGERRRPVVTEARGVAGALDVLLPGRQVLGEPREAPAAVLPDRPQLEVDGHAGGPQRVGEQALQLFQPLLESQGLALLLPQVLEHAVALALELGELALELRPVPEEPEQALVAGQRPEAVAEAGEHAGDGLHRPTCRRPTLRRPGPATR